MKRALLAAFVLAALVGAVYAFLTLSREQSYRRLIAAGNAALEADETFEAVEAFSGAIVLKPDSLLAHVRRGEVYRRQGQLQAAERDLRRAWHLDPTATRPLVQLADVHFELRNYARAAERYADYVAIDDGSPRVFYKLALARYRAGNPAAAIEPLQRAVELNERFSEAHYLLGLCLREAGRTPEALDALERAVRLAPAFIVGREELADVFRELARAADEIDQLEALSALDPLPARRVTLGLAQARAGRHRQAVTTLSQEADRAPENADVYVALGRIWLETSDGGRDRIALSKALEALASAAGRAEEPAEARALFGRALLQAGDYEMAERVLQQAVSRLPVDPLALLALADAAEQLGHIGEARQALLKYQVLMGEDANPARQAQRAARVGELSIQLQDYPTAVSWLRRASEATPGARLLALLAEAQLGAGDPVGAAATVERGLQMEPRNRALLALSRRTR